MKKKDGQYINSIIRAIDILNLYTSNKTHYGVTEISKNLNLPKTTIFRIIKTLEEKGWLVKDEPTNKYKLGFEILNVASSVVRNYSYNDIIIEEMKKLAEEYNESVFLHVYDDYAARCIQKIEMQNYIKISSEIGKKSPLHVGASSKIILAYQKPEIINYIISQGLPKYTNQSIIDGDELLEDLAEIRRLGYSISFGEIDLDVTAIAAPILYNEELLYGLSIIAPTSRILIKGVEEMKNTLLYSTERICQRISIIEQLR